MSYYHHDPSHASKSLRSFLPGLLVIVLLITGGGLFVKSTLAANIAISSGNPIEFGQSVSQTVACSGGDSLTLTPRSSFTNGSPGAHYLKSVTVANIPDSCFGVDFTINAYNNTSSTPLALFNTSSRSAVIYNNNGAFSRGIGSTGMTIESSTGTFTATFTVPVAQSSTVFKLTIQSGEHTPSYEVGDRGPGGGIIYYVSAAGFSCGPTRSETCRYLEVAPSGWNGGADPTNRWAQQTPVDYSSTTVASPNTATATGIGWGYRNTRAIVAQGNTSSANSVAPRADSYTVTVSGVIYDDWYLPSKDELNQMCKWARNQAWVSDATVCDNTGSLNSGPGASGFGTSYYWSSSEYTSNMAFAQVFGDGTQPSMYKFNYLSIRPIRAF